MPIYEYECRECTERIALLRPIRDMDALARCPRCGRVETVRRVVSSFAAPCCTPAG